MTEPIRPEDVIWEPAPSDPGAPILPTSPSAPQPAAMEEESDPEQEEESA